MAHNVLFPPFFYTSLRRKAELQKKASKPISFTDNLAAEKKKKEELKKSKEERRNALCEELGRGC